jgi:hypothetical protein
VIGFHNADDGIDVSFINSTIQDCISFDNGPKGNKGYKILRRARNLNFWGNIAFSNHNNGFEFRMIPQESFYVYNNLAIRNNKWGMSGINSESYARNNLGAYNLNTDLGFGSCVGCSNNWAEDTDGDPGLINENLVVDTNFPQGLTVAQKVEYIRDQFRVAFSPEEGSPLIDAGIVVSGYHCNTSGAHPGNSCREWYGSAPDIGAFEYIANDTTPTPPPTQVCISDQDLMSYIIQWKQGTETIEFLVGKIVEWKNQVDCP